MATPSQAAEDTMPPILSLRHYNQDQIIHSHQHTQLVFGLQGQLDFEIDGRGSRIHQQLLAVVPSAAQHACDSVNGSLCLVVDLPDLDWMRTRLGHHADSARRMLDQAAALRLSATQNQLVTWLSASPINDPIIAEQGAVLLLASLASGCEPIGRRSPLPLDAIHAHIDRHLAHPLEVRDLARLAGLSVQRFHHRFVNETGKTPQEFIRLRRLHEGRELIVSTQLPIGEIATRVGYSSQSAFTAALSRKYGSTPRVLRREPRDKTRG
ncbi:helix-turn-helix transcriptional regulator [Stutzerimonas zhaodongensis]|uniref:helix-turn-helix transcriptional regulator n=1 Tax=Stutzerimonas zhaodongensis TaxID=1176257 RepID=UPI002106D7A7|nr:AraC family transcriptional regulator [Stutzerimonas zhaodongensis]MCQ2031309.1 AraC family transcriptional regulator [Stutzerimonas zhaodongensis]